MAKIPRNFKFDPQEIFCPHVLLKYGDVDCWWRLDQKAVDALHWLREGIGKRVFINNYHLGGDDDQSGVRCNLCQLVRNKTDVNETYASAHVLWKAFDLSVEGMDAEEVRRWIHDNKDTLPHNIRLEKDVPWVHIDVIDTGRKIYCF
jgi:hypothetical protein